MSSAPLPSPSDFQTTVLEALGNLLPGRRFEPGIDAFGVRCGAVLYSLDRLFREACDLGGEGVGTLIDLRLKALLRLPERVGSFDTVAASIRPRFVPMCFGERVDPLGWEFPGELLLTLAVVESERLHFLRPVDAQTWGHTPEELLTIALANLEHASAGMELHQLQGPEPALIVQTLDGFDAERLLLPGLQEFAASMLGEPFRAAMPTRDFLVLWRDGASADFDKLVRGRVGVEFRNQDHPLSTGIFRVTRESLALIDRVE